MSSCGEIWFKIIGCDTNGKIVELYSMNFFNHYEAINSIFTVKGKVT